MAVKIYMDVHVKFAVTRQLRVRGVDVLTAIEDGRDELPDDELLRRAQELGRVMFTQDDGFKVLARRWQKRGIPFAGLAFGAQLDCTVGELVRDLELIAKCTDPEDALNDVQFLPL